MGILRTSPEILVNTSTQQNQLDSRVAVLDDGRFVVSWTTEHPTDGDGRAVLASIFNADGTPSAGQFLVNTTAGESQLESSIAVLADGRIVISWRDDSNTAGDTSFAAIRARIVNPDGSPSVPEFLVNTSILNSQDESQLVALADGRFMVTWTDDSLANNALLGSDIRARIFNPDGSQSVGEFVVNTTTGSHQFDSSIAQLADGRIVVSWTDASFTVGDTSGFAIRARIFNPNGTQAVSEFVVTKTTLNNQFESSIAALADGRFVVSWTDGTGDGSGDAIKARIFNANGTESVPEFLVNSTTVSTQLDSQIAVLADGRLIAVWTDFSATGDDSNLGAIRARIFNPDGTEAIPEFVVNTITTSQQTESSIAVMQDGSFVVTWTDLSQTGGDLFGKAIRSQVFDPTVFDGTNAADVITGGSLRDVHNGNDGNDILSGGGGDDELNGGAGNDSLKGGIGNDLLTGDTGNDILEGNAGADEMRGGLGNDTYFIDTSDTVVEDANAGIDTIRSASTFSIASLSNIERLAFTGTANANGTGNTAANILTGNAGLNTLNGAAGADQLIGGKGRDTLIGGTQSDRFKFSAGDSGQTATTMDRISDFTKGAVNAGDRFDFAEILAIGGVSTAATANRASINQTTGVATFAAGSGTDMADALADIARRLTASGDAEGEFALFRVNNTGTFHVFASDGVAGVGPNDLLVQLTGITSIGSINLTGGDLTILS